MGYGFTLVACFVEIKLKVCTNRELLSDRVGKKAVKIDNSFPLTVLRINRLIHGGAYGGSYK